MKSFSLSKTSLMGWPGVCCLLVLFFDHLTKFLVYHNWPEPYQNEIIVVPGVFRLVHWRNLGAAWGIFAGRTWLLGCLSLAVSLAMVFCWRRVVEKNPRYAIPCGVLLGGVLGNMVDRFFFCDGVVDFLRFEFWPAFNVADSTICCSVVYLVIYEFFFARKNEKPKEE